MRTAPDQLISNDENVRAPARSRIATRGCECGESDPGISARDIDDLLAGLELAALLGVADQAPCRPVLDAAGRVQILDLGKDSRAELQLLGKSAEFEQRRIADQSGEIVVSRCHDALSRQAEKCGCVQSFDGWFASLA